MVIFVYGKLPLLRSLGINIASSGATDGGAPDGAGGIP